MVQEEAEKNGEQPAEKTNDPFINSRLWMIRNCDWYEEEYSDCKSIRSRFHQNFVFGEQLDCSQWKRDSANCLRWKNSKDLESARELINSETKRREERLAPYYNNDIWEHRTEPPENWNSPLPEWMQKENETSFLAFKAEEEKNIKHDILSSRQNICAIM